jgi:LAO/AO transport system kinase
MASNVGDMDVFFRSMSARGNLGGLSTATADAVKALDAFGKDRIIVETVGAGQNEIDIVRAANTVAVLVPPSSGDGVQMLKAGILEIGDVFVVNKADLDGADRTVQELREMIEMSGGSMTVGGGHHGFDTVEVDVGDEEEWTPSVVETVATDGEGVEDLLGTLDDHQAYMTRTGELERKARGRVANEIRTLLRDDAAGLASDELDRRGGIEEFVARVQAGDTNPYDIAADVLADLRDCVESERR